MSDTPRTDEQEFRIHARGDFDDVVDAGFARDLEREIADLQKELGKPDFCCMECGSLGPFSGITYPASQDGPEEYDIQCDGCGSVNVAESATEVLQRWNTERADALEELKRWKLSCGEWMCRILLGMTTGAIIYVILYLTLLPN